MKNFKQVIAPLILAIFVAGTAVLVNAAWSDPTCGPTGCNVDTLINTGDENQIKDGQFASSGYVDTNSISYDGIIASMTNIESAKKVTVGTASNTADFRVVHGNSWFKNPVSVGDQSLTQTSSPTVGYDLQVKGTTNIGRGDYCTLRANQLENETTGICPMGGTFGPTFMNWYRADATVNTIAAHCGKLAPTTNSAPQDLGSCYTTSAPSVTGGNSVKTGSGGGYIPYATCGSYDTFAITATMTDTDATPLTFQWQSRSKVNNGTWSSWANVPNSNSITINTNIDKHGYLTPTVTNSPANTWGYQVKVTDSLGQTNGFVGVTQQQSIYRPHNYVDSNGTNQTCP